MDRVEAYSVIWIFRLDLVTERIEEVHKLREHLVVMVLMYLNNWCRIRTFYLDMF